LGSKFYFPKSENSIIGRFEVVLKNKKKTGNFLEKGETKKSIKKC